MQINKPRSPIEWGAYGSYPGPGARERLVLDRESLPGIALMSLTVACCWEKEGCERIIVFRWDTVPAELIMIVFVGLGLGAAS